MTQTIDKAALLTFRFTQDADQELWQIGVKTQARQSVNWGALLTGVHTAFMNNIAGLINKSHLVGIAYSEWDTVGFTGFHQRTANIYNDGLGGNAVLPPQDAVVISLLETTSLHPIRSRRGRLYHGGVAVGALDSNGRLTVAQQTGIRDAWKAVGTALQGLALDAGVTEPGLCVCSPKSGTIIQATQIGVGLGIDTQRRRRRHVVESIAYTTA